MDLSALIFVALAVAWATYLIPKALRHHEDSNSSRSVEGFSTRIRILARREPVDSTSARLVVGDPTPAVETRSPVKAPAKAPMTAPAAATPTPTPVRRAAAARAARRRLRVVLTILLAGVAMGVAVALGHLASIWLAAPGGVLIAWLVACRVMVKRERAAVPRAGRRPITVERPGVPGPAGDPAVTEADPVTEEIVAVELTVEAERAAAAAAATPDPEPPVARAEPASQRESQRESQPESQRAPESQSGAGWDPVPTTLPTYVGKEPAVRRSVRTIDLDSTGVWTSGPLASDSALAREADAERATRAQARSDKERRASGS